MQRLLILVLFFISTASAAQKTQQVRFETGELMVEKKFDPNCQCERVTEYYKSGKLLSKKIFRNLPGIGSVVDGEDVRYYENGNIQLYYFWKNGHPEGRMYSVLENGNLGYEIFYKDGFKSGTWKWYNHDGSLREETIQFEGETEHDADTRHGIYKTYLNGKLVITETFNMNKKEDRTIADSSLYEEWEDLQPDLGVKMFQLNCWPCHIKGEVMSGPVLKGVTEKRSNRWLTQMIKNGEMLVQGGDKIAKALKAEHSGNAHPNFEWLSDEELKAIIQYLETFN